MAPTTRIKKFSIFERLRSFRYGLNGMKIIFRYEHNFRIHCLVAAIVLFAGIATGLKETEWLAILIVSGLVFISEMFNSAIEYMADFISPGYSEMIRKVKDVSAAAVLLSAIISVITGILIFYPKFF
ncbi:MAG: diacylglycerol kinase family protein [Bacteroidota bacterium]